MSRRERRTNAEKEFFAARPIKPDLGILGRKWALLILADIGLRRVDRFSSLLRSNPEINPRILSRRLKELEKDGIIKKTEDSTDGIVRWALTEKGEDSLPILMRLIAFGSKWYARDVFEDKVPRSLNEIFTRPEAQEIVQKLYES